MRTKTIVNSKGEPQAAKIEFVVKGSGGVIGVRAIERYRSGKRKSEIKIIHM